MRGFSNFLKKVQKQGLTISYERVRKPHWSIFYCVYCFPSQPEPVKALAQEYHENKGNRSYINVYQTLLPPEVKG